MRSTATKVFLFTLALAVTVPAHAGFVLPEAKNSEPGYSSIRKDLLAEHAKELAQARRLAKAGRKPRRVAVAALFRIRNRELVHSLLRKEQVATDSGSGVRWLTEAQASEVHASMAQHPVVSDAATRRYDTPHEQIGYCFGRAAFVHWELLHRGVRRGSVGKIFAVGPFGKENRFWEFHVATLVRAAEGGWWVIDRLQPRVLGLEEWMENVSQWGEHPAHPELRFYFSHAAKFLPLPGAYSEKKLSATVYKGYFRDLLAWFESRPRLEVERFRELPRRAGRARTPALAVP